MNRETIRRIAVLGSATGMRSFSGVAALALSHGGPLARVVPAMAAAEMVADKTSVVGNRTDPAPLVGRALLGGLVGAILARADGESPALGALFGAAMAVAAAHAAFQLRTRIPGNAAALGIAEDLAVAGMCFSATRRDL